MKKRLAPFFRQRPAVMAFRRLLGDTRGSIAIMFAFCLAFLLVAAGTAVDGMRFFMMRSELRGLADSAAVAAGANPLNNTKEKLETVATAYVRANANANTAGNISITSEYKKDTQEFTLRLSSRLPATFLKIAGIQTLTTDATAEVLRALTGPIEMALALDVTMSMNNAIASADKAETCPTVNPLTNTQDKLITKLDVLRCAFTTLVLDLSVYVVDAPPGKQRNAMKVGAVPFATYVNVGSRYTSANWLSGPTQFPGFAPDPGSPLGLKPIIVNWSGCIGYRAAALRDSLEDPTANKYPRVNQGTYPCQGNENRIVPLRSIYAEEDRKALLQSLTPSDNTGNASVLPSGILWAWQFLHNESAAAPSPGCDPDMNASLPDSCNPIFKSARSYEDMKDRKGRKVVVIFTDGWNIWGPDRDTAGVQMGSYKDKSDTDMANLCKNMKNKKIEVFVVSFLGIKNDTELNRLRSCADPGKFLEANSASELIAAFRNIAVSFRPVRLTE